MLSTTNSAIPSENMVTYKFKVTDLADLFEAFTPEQSHIALEGALNIIFGRSPEALACVAVPGEETEDTTEEDVDMDHEDLITDEAVYSLYCQQLAVEASALVPEGCATAWVIPEEYQGTDLYKQMEEQFRNIVTKISDDITADQYNQDVITLHGEMQFFSRIELFTYNYNSNIDILAVTIAAMIS